MNRRAFFGLLARGTLGAVVALHLPAAIVPYRIRHYAALEFLHRHYNDFSGRHGWDAMPTDLRLGTALFDQFENELPFITRFTSSPQHAFKEPTLMFKAIVARRDTSLPPWQMTIANARGDVESAVLL